jgi:predicted transcriptional regulator
MQPHLSTSLVKVKEHRILRVQRAEAVAFLLDVRELRWLQPFMTAERNLTSVAKELEGNLSHLSRKVQRMMKLELLEVTRTETRKGRSITFYRASADEFFIPEDRGAISAVVKLSDKAHNRQLH